MANDIQVFTFEGSKHIRVVRADGEPWRIARR